MIDKKFRFIIPAALALIYIILELSVYPYIFSASYLLMTIVPLALVAVAVACDDREKQLPALACSGVAAALTVINLARIFFNYISWLGFFETMFYMLLNLFASIGFLLTFAYIMTPKAKRNMMWLLLFAASRVGYLALSVVIVPLFFGGYFRASELIFLLVQTLLFASIFLPGLARESAPAPAAASDPAAALKTDSFDVLEAYKKNMNSK